MDKIQLLTTDEEKASLFAAAGEVVDIASIRPISGAGGISGISSVADDDDDANVNPEAASAKKNKRFKSIARRIKVNLKWLHEMDNRDIGGDDDEEFVVRLDESDGGRLTFNVNQFINTSKSYAALSPKVKKILTKVPCLRTDSDVTVLREVVGRLKCFERYSRTVKKELAKVISYESFGDGRIIIQQGHKGLSFYFIVAGAVTVKISTVDKQTKRKMTHVLGELTEGSSFGELALLHNTTRTATIICKGNSEFLRVDKPDFDEVLSTAYQRDWEERYGALRGMPHFDDWSDIDLKSCTHNTLMQEFGSNKVIIGNTNESPEYVYFIQTGECKLVKEISEDGKLGMPLLRRNQVSSTVKKPTVDTRKRMSIAEKRFLSVCKLRKHHFFGVGEDMKDTYIITCTRVECILVPRIAFIKYGKIHQLDIMQDAVRSALPSEDDIVRRYEENFDWQTYKQQLIAAIVGNRNIKTRTTMGDVPAILQQDNNV